MSLPDFKTLAHEYSVRQATRSALSSMSKHDILSLDPAQFFLSMSAFTPQAYGAWIQAYIINKLGAQPVPSKINKGDFTTSNGHHFELKSSLITESNPTLNLVQIRPWQDIYGYYAIAIDLRAISELDADPNVFKSRIYIFQLSKAHMAHECETLKASSAHGTSAVSCVNTKNELRLSIKVQPDDATFSRWLHTYQQPNDFLFN